MLALWEAGEISASRAAQELDLGIHGFLDLLAAKGLPVVRGDLDLDAIEEASRKPVLDGMRQQGFGIDDMLYDSTLRAAGEWPTA